MKTKLKLKLGRILEVDNKRKHKAANSKYSLVYLEGFYKTKDGKPTPYLFTTAQLVEARDRAQKNKEDCGALSKWWKFW